MALLANCSESKKTLETSSCSRSKLREHEFANNVINYRTRLLQVSQLTLVLPLDAFQWCNQKSDKRYKLAHFRLQFARRLRKTVPTGSTLR